MQVFTTNVVRSSSYLQSYTAWMMASNLFGAVGGVLSSHSMLSSSAATAFLGNAPSPDHFALTANWVCREAAGQIGSLLWTWKRQSNSDRHPIRSATHASRLQAGSTLIEAATPLLATCHMDLLFLPMASVANIGKNVSWIGMAAVNSKLLASATSHDTLAGTYSMLSARASCASSIGMVLGIGAAYIFKDPGVRVIVTAVMMAAQMTCYHRSLVVLGRATQATTFALTEPPQSGWSGNQRVEDVKNEKNKTSQIFQ